MLSPDFVNEPPRRVIGFKAPFRSALSPETNNLDVIPALWNRLIPRMREIASNAPGISLGVILCEPGSEGELTYLAGCPVAARSAVPAGMVAIDLPGGLYARFTHSAPLSELGETMRRIYAEWVPSSGYDLDLRPDIEVYDHRFRPDIGQTTFDILIPIKEK